MRDKIAASKRKGIWVGGPVPLGNASVGKKPVILPADAEIVRAIFARYLELGSVAALAEDLDRKEIRTKRHVRSTGRVQGGGRFGVGALAYLLKNRFYVGEVVYRGEVYRGDRQPIIERAVFETVQEKLAQNAVDRDLQLKGSLAVLAGRIFDDRGNRMTPSHANKKGVRYRYYVSHAVLQKRKQDAGSVVRVPASDVETMVVNGVRAHLAEANIEVPAPTAERDVVEQYVERVVLKPDAIEVSLTRQARIQQGEGPHDGSQGAGENEGGSDAESLAATVLSLPWLASGFVAVKGVLHAPVELCGLNPEARDALRTAIAKARLWIDDLIAGRVTSFAEIAAREGKVERHVRNLAVLAFVSPKVIVTIVDGTASSGLTVTGLAQALPYVWAEQEQQFI